MDDTLTLSETTQGALLLLLVLIPLYWTAWRRDAFRLDYPTIRKWQASSSVTGLRVSTGFLLWFGVIFIFGVVISLANQFSLQDKGIELSRRTLNMVGLMVAPVQLVVLLFTVSRMKGVWHHLFPSSSTRFSLNVLKQYRRALLTYILALPAISLLALIVSALLYWLLGFEESEQVVVEQVRSFAQDPQLFAMAMGVVIVAAPICEEILFRGLLLSWLCKKLPVGYALVLSAMLFGLLHMDTRQGWGNIQIVLSIWMLGIYLGHLFLRQRTLWASIALHMIFNAASSLVIFIKES